MNVHLCDDRWWHGVKDMVFTYNILIVVDTGTYDTAPIEVAFDMIDFSIDFDEIKFDNINSQ